jgi:hypothetical protein
MMRRALVAALAALLGTACAPHDAEWATAVLEHDPLGPDAAAAYRLLMQDGRRDGPPDRAVPVSTGGMY